MTWQPGSTMPKDGSPFVFRDRSTATGELGLPMVGKFENGQVWCVRDRQWVLYGDDVTQWAGIPPIV